MGEFGDWVSAAADAIGLPDPIDHSSSHGKSSSGDSTTDVDDTSDGSD